MACSRKHALGRAAVALALACSCALGGVSPAFGAASTAERVEEPVRVEAVTTGLLGIDATAAVGEGGAGETLALPRFTPVAVSAACSPGVIDVGVDCGMPDMCGIDPCLCGSADAWGGCSCNGIEQVAPTVTYESSDQGVVRVEQAFGRAWLVPAGPGEATVTVTASLKYHETTTASVPVTVTGPAAADAAVGGIALAAVAVVIAAAFGVRRAMRVHRGKDSHDEGNEGAGGAGA